MGGGLILCQLVRPGVGCPQGYGFIIYWIYLVFFFFVYCSSLIMLVFVKKIYLFDFSVFICLSWLAAGLLLC